MKVLLVGSEANPFIKTGGLGDVLGSLSKSLNMIDVDARVVIPKYKNINNDLKSELKFLKAFNVKVGWRNQYCGIFECTYEGRKYYLLDNEYYFNRDELYDYYDDGERFAFFNRAVLKFLKELNFKPDIINCNDWHTGMIPVLLKLEYMRDIFYQNIKTVFSIHNLRFQGIFPKETLPELFGYDLEAYYNGSLAFDDGVSFMKGGLLYSDKITTVSYSYVNEIKTSQYGERLDSVLRDRGEALSGILNGIDYDEFNPENDKFIYTNFSKNYLDGKARNKELLQEELGLPINKDIAMIGVVSRLTNQKGLDLIIDIADRLLQHNIQLIILGTGDHNYEDHFKGLSSRYRDKVSTHIKFDNKLAHKIYAASDMFLMPSLFEPCGLGQLIALRYGTIPIVRETGGLRDTVSPYNEYNGIGNGFSFRNYNGNELLNIIEYALELYRNKDIWNTIVIQALDSDNSLNRSANRYKEIYSSLIRS